MKKQNFMKLFSQRNSSQSLFSPSVKQELIIKCIGGPCKLLTTKQTFIGTKGVINKSLLDGNSRSLYSKEDGETYFGSSASEANMGFRAMDIQM